MKEFFWEIKNSPQTCPVLIFPHFEQILEEFLFFDFFLCFLVTAKVTKTDYFYYFHIENFLYFFHFFFFSRFTSSPRLPSIFSNFTIVRSNEMHRARTLDSFVRAYCPSRSLFKEILQIGSEKKYFFLCRINFEVQKSH